MSPDHLYRVNIEVDCPECGALVDRFYTKDSSRRFSYVRDTQSLDHFYGFCPNAECESYIEFFRLIDGLITNFEMIYGKGLEVYAVNVSVKEESDKKSKVIDYLKDTVTHAITGKKWLA